MVKYYFQLLNGELKYVAHGSKQDLKDRLDSDFKQDTVDAIKALTEHNETAQAKIDDLLKNYPSDEGQRLETDCLIAQLKNAIYKNKKEIDRVSRLKRENLVFFELKQIDV
jgi:peptidoglycan hydrolase CwlO-like protein